MKIEKRWTANSKSEKIGNGKELINIAGQWGLGIEVSIIKPYIYSKGPVEINKETCDRESMLSPIPA